MSQGFPTIDLKAAVLVVEVGHLEGTAFLLAEGVMGILPLGVVIVPREISNLLVLISLRDISINPLVEIRISINIMTISFSVDLRVGAVGVPPPGDANARIHREDLPI